MPKIVNICIKYLHVSQFFCTFARFLKKMCPCIAGDKQEKAQLEVCIGH